MVFDCLFVCFLGGEFIVWSVVHYIGNDTMNNRGMGNPFFFPCNKSNKRRIVYFITFLMSCWFSVYMCGIRRK